MTEKIVGIIPIRGSDAEFRDGRIPMLGDRSLLDYTLQAAKESKRLDRVIVSTDSQFIADHAKKFGVEAPFLRPSSLSAPSVTGTQVLLHTVEWLEKNESFKTAWVVKMEVTHPFRPVGIVDKLIETALANGVDSAFLAHVEKNNFWTLNEEGIPQMVGSGGDNPRKTKSPFYRELSGLGAITRVENLKAGQLYGQNLGIIPFQDSFATIDIHDGTGSDSTYKLAEFLAPAFTQASKP